MTIRLTNLALIILLLLPVSLSAQVVINEFSCANRNINTDNYGENEDWIELYNTSGSAVDLSGYYLSDKAGNPTKWQIPTGATIAANGYRLIWASNRNENSGGNLHTNFKLTQTINNEYVVFASPTGVIIDSVHITPTRANMSRGRQTDGSATWGVFTDPSPNAANGPATEFYNGFAPTPDIEPSSGGYAATVSVTITCADPTASIYYTTNGNTPTNASTLYTGAFDVTNTQVVKAIVISTDATLLRSFMETNTYFINVSHTIPVISISGDQVDNLINGNSGIQPAGAFELFNANLELQDEAIGEFNKHGNDSWAYPQRGIDYITRDEFGYDNDIDDEIFSTTNRDEFQRLILKAAASDNYPFEGGGAHIRDAFVQQLSQVGNLNLDERSYEPCVLYVNGQYWGVYEIREKVDDSDFTDHYYDKGEYDIDYIQTWGWTWNAYGTFDAWDDLRTFVLNNDMSNDANYAYVTERLDPLSLIDYVTLNGHVVCADWLNYNTAWWHSTDNQVRWRYTLWDMDATFGHYVNYTGIPDQSPNADPCNVESPQLSDPEQQIGMFSALLNNEQFMSMYINRYAELNNTVFSCDFMLNLLNQMVARLEPEMPEHIARWGGSMAEWQGNVQDIRDFIETRCTVIDQGIVDCYDVTGPFPLTVVVEPPLSGNVTLNTLELQNYPFTGDYFGDISVNMSATPQTGWVFDYWEMNNHTVLPDNTSAVASFGMTTTDTLIAHFKFLNPVTLTIIIDNPTGGTLAVNGEAITASPTTITLNANDLVTLLATTQWNFTFDGYELNNHTILPDGSFIITQNDTLTVHFTPIVYGITYIVEPTGGGNINLNGNNLLSYPYTQSYDINTNVNLSAIPAAGYEFAYWEATNSLLFPSNNDSSVVFNTSSNDTITLHLNQLPIPTYTITIEVQGSGNVTANGTSASPLPYSITLPQGTPLDLSALAAAGYQFDSWQVVGQSLSNTTNTTLNFVPTNNLNVTAIFTEIPIIPTYTITIVIGDAQQGSISVNGQIINTSPYTITLTQGDTLNLAALAAAGFTFVEWQTSIEGLNTNNAAFSFVPNANGTLSVIFAVQSIKAILIPNAFSPNNDGTNDEFKVTGNDVLSLNLKLFDRWGNSIFETNNPQIGWDGTQKGKNLPVGTYTYYAVITTTTNETITKKGFVILVR